MTDDKKFYELDLPVFRCGDDLAYWLDETNDDIPLAFKKLANQYEVAARVCSKLASTIFENKDVELVSADTYQIRIAANPDHVKGLVDDGILFDEEDILDSCED